MIKRIEIASPVSCLNKAADDEPVFVLRAQDAIAPIVVRNWAGLLEDEYRYLGKPGEPLRAVPEPVQAKIAEARALADAMEAWPDRKLPD